jgi:catechol 2,3-dioxygenase-like lactoylglutathione lyase family enzyme
MSTTQPRSERGGDLWFAGDMKLGVIVPVSDVDRAKRYYGGLGWRPAAGFGNGRDFRVVQLTPPGSQCAIHFGKGLTTAEPGSAQSLCLVVQDVEAARSELIGHGAEVSEAFQENRHGQYEPTAPKHHWSGWYAAFIVAREEGRAPDEAAREAALHVERTRN